MTPGFQVCSHSEYHADPCPEPSLSRSIAEVMLAQSPRHAWHKHPRLNPAWEAEDANAAMDMGDIAHQLVLGQEERFAISPRADWRGNEARDFKEAAISAGKVPVLAHKMEESRALAKAVRVQLDEGGLHRVFTAGQMEQTICWQSGNVWLRSRLDQCLIFEDRQRAEIWDLKTTTNANPKAIAKKIYDRNYDLQVAFYEAALAAIRPELSGRIDFNFVFVEAKLPFAICISTPDGQGRTIGISKYERAVALWKECVASGKWPCYGCAVHRAEPPPWALAGEIGAESISETMNR